MIRRIPRHVLHLSWEPANHRLDKSRRTSQRGLLAALLLPLCLTATPLAMASDESCTASHRIVVSHALIGHEPADVIGLSQGVAERLSGRLEAAGQQVVKQIQPTRSGGLEPAMDAFSRHAAPWFVRLAADDLGTEGTSSAIVLLPDRYAPRAGRLSATLDNGARATRLDDWQLRVEPADGTPYSPPADVASERFWQSDWGKSLDQGIERLADAILGEIRCRPLIGRVISSEHRDGQADLRIDLGRRDGLVSEDELLVIRPGTPVESLGVNLLTRPDLETSVGPVREPRSLGKARVVYLGEHDSTLRYEGNHDVDRGDLVQVR